ncbi:glucosaminidase domain-containing protein [Chryseobacterium paridis]|uniref:Glucosaminidase domain-containing protein n=1 Tax=Chryseobacterium paridis TaxID=2800328 RepID=A0ABS1FX80_9FLAO|nr:glucosaminidase domain-containing protein [Chryseobacterium paridis]MBK1896794.1 glucosaminidase domain-containing protein [Chryseobacterium paridis]
MKRSKNSTIAVLSLFLTFFFTMANAQRSYIDSYKGIATDLSKQYGIPSSIILAIAIVESGAGTSKASKTLNNHFGILGKNNINTSRFKSFNSVRESYEAFCLLLSKKKLYTKLKDNNNSNDWVKAIASSGYSTKPNEWIKKINTTIIKFGL